MKAHTSEFKNKIKTMGRELDSKITYTLNGVNVELGKEQLNSITPTYQGALLKSVMKELDIDSNVYIPEKTILNYKFGVKVNGEYEYINYGNYVVYKAEKQEDTNSYKLTCYDKMLYSMVDYEKMDITYPISIKDYIKAICDKLGLTFKNANSTFANYDKQIQNELYLDSSGNSLGYTFRDVFDELSQVTASCICINENDELEIRYVGENINASEASSDNNIISIEDALGNNALSYNIDGKCEQETRSGKNLFNSSLYSNATQNGITLTKNDDGTITLNGTSTAQTDFNVIDLFSILADSNTTASIRKISGSYANNGSSSLSVEWNISDGSWGNRIYTNLDGINYNVSTGSKMKDGITYKKCTLRIQKGVTCTNLVLGLQIEKGDITSFEQYGASPSPDYPSEIKTVKGIRNLINASKAFEEKLGKTFNRNGLTFTTNEDGTINIKGTTTARTQIDFLGDWNNTNVLIPTDDNKKYTFSTNFNHSSLTISYKDSNDTIKRIYTDNATAKLIENCKGITQLAFDIKNATSIDLNMYIQLEQGSTAHPYVPYGSWLRAKVTGKNIFDKDNVVIGYIRTSDGTIASNTTDKTSGFIEVEPNTKYSRTTKNTIAFYDKDKNYISYVYEKSGITPSNCKYVRITIINANVDNEQLEKGEPTEYEPYKEQEVLVDMNIYDDDGNITGYHELASIGDTKDNLEVVSGVLKKKIGKVVLDDSENWYANGVHCQATLYGIKNIKNDIKPYSNYFNGVIYSSSDFGISITQTSGEKFLRINNGINKFGSITDFKTWLSNNPVTVYYVLAEEETINLTPTNVPLFDGINNISLLDTIDTKTSVEYQTEYDTIDEEFLKDVNVNFGEKYGPINSIVLSRSSESDNVYLQDTSSVELNGLCEIKIKDNQIMNWNDRSNYLPDILERLNGIKYYLNDYSSTGVCYYDLLDKYNVKICDNTYPCIMLNDEVNITQGLEENIYTEMPEETETDYTKADKTDRKINQTYLIVDKQNQKIEALNGKIVDLTNFVKRVYSNENFIKLDNTPKSIGAINKLSIKNFELKNLCPGMSFPSDYTYLNILNLYTIILSSEKVIYSDELPTPNNQIELYNVGGLNGKFYRCKDNKWNEETELSNISYININSPIPLQTQKIGTEYFYDEIIIENSEAKIIQRISWDNQKNEYIALEKPIEYNLGIVKLQTFETDTYITLKYFNNLIFDTEYIIKNELTENFATSIESKALISITDEINLEVSEKVGNDQIASSISQTKDKIFIKSNNFGWESKNSNMTTDGKITATAGNIGGFYITEKSFEKNVNGIYDYNLYDAFLAMFAYLYSNSDKLPPMLDYNKDGKVNMNDVGKIINVVNGNIENEHTETGRFVIDSNSPKNCLLVIDSNDETSVSLGTGGINTKLIISRFIMVANEENTTSNQHIIMDGINNQIVVSDGNTKTYITPTSVTPGSLAETKKDFEIFKSALSIIDDIDIYKYHYKGEDDTKKKHIGFVIGDKFNYSSEITAEDNDGKEIGVDLYSMVSLCLQAIKEQQEIINDLKEEINKIKESDK